MLVLERQLSEMSESQAELVAAEKLRAVEVRNRLINWRLKWD